MSTAQIRLYYREGCHLCEELAGVLYRGWPSRLDHVEWVDVDCSPELIQGYGSRVPVLEVDGEEVCQFQPDMERLISIFGEPANPV